MRISIYFTGLLLCLSSSCDFLNKNDEQKNLDALAKVNEKVLYLKDVESIVGESSSERDSLDKLQAYVNSWVKQQLILEKVAQYLPEEKQSIEQQVQEYRSALLTALYEKELVQQKLDTLVSNSELKQFYEANSSNFLLRNPVFQLYYIKVSKEAPKLDSLRYWTGDVDQHKKSLSNYCFAYAEDFSLKDSTWIKQSLLYQKFPVNEEMLKQLKRTKQAEELVDSDYFYFLKVNDWKEQGELAPFNLVSNDIQKLILNQRKLKLIEQAYNQIYQEGIKKGKFEIY